MPFSSPALLHNMASALIDVCEGFLDPTSHITAGIDLRFMSRVTPDGMGSGAGHFDSSEEAVLSKIMAQRAVTSPIGAEKNSASSMTSLAGAEDSSNATSAKADRR